VQGVWHEGKFYDSPTTAVAAGWLSSAVPSASSASPGGVESSAVNRPAIARSGHGMQPAGSGMSSPSTGSSGSSQGVVASSPLAKTPINPPMLHGLLTGDRLEGARAALFRHLPDQALQTLSGVDRLAYRATTPEVQRRVDQRLMQVDRQASRPAPYKPETQEILATQPRLSSLFRQMYHATLPDTAEGFVRPEQPAEILPAGKGEFGKGFYAFDEHANARSIAPEYAKEKKSSKWSIVRFTVPTSLYRGLEQQPRDEARHTGHLTFPAHGSDRNPKRLWGDLHRPEDRGRGTLRNWHDFVEREEKEDNRGYSLITGPIKQTLDDRAAEPHPTQYLFANSGLGVLNDARTTRQIVQQSGKKPRPAGRGAVRGPAGRSADLRAAVAAPSLRAPATSVSSGQPEPVAASSATSAAPSAVWTAEVTRIQNAIDGTAGKKALASAALRNLLKGLDDFDDIDDVVKEQTKAELQRRFDQPHPQAERKK
jgi:hypothetical protein